VHKRPDSVDNGRPVWTSAARTVAGSVDHGDHRGAGVDGVVAAPSVIHRSCTRPSTVLHWPVHDGGGLVHRSATHGHTGPSTVSTPRWWWWRD